MTCNIGVASFVRTWCSTWYGVNPLWPWWIPCGIFSTISIIFNKLLLKIIISLWAYKCQEFKLYFCGSHARRLSKYLGFFLVSPLFSTIIPLISCFEHDHLRMAYSRLQSTELEDYSTLILIMWLQYSNKYWKVMHPLWNEDPIKTKINVYRQIHIEDWTNQHQMFLEQCIYIF